jgi:hypothetical protein
VTTYSLGWLSDHWRARLGGDDRVDLASLDRLELVIMCSKAAILKAGHFSSFNRGFECLKSIAHFLSLSQNQLVLSRC